ncbi:LacI family DNA-binding transcriptional regulator [Flexilinea flocculi]|uniref:DNA-binding transcriptional regulator, LacI/PurR family n=1 Tax=Flexilinea flocculi TaxID=1678840 RepID=A0A0S7BS29_9CHLR|nr:LacI family DNA-binding transcriptional regulator [Flexilinea flocculi]NMB94751.1 LacI family transcriptional regulator [Flexilinea flocculi]GAP40209.1 DNA-binding transcriptional regulator, LacI/PurR family [Flexilinea flocculi]
MITVKEIAALIGVSPATVSLALNNKEGVSEETRRKIRKVAEEHQYALPQVRKNTLRGSIQFVKYAAHGMVVEENQGFIASIIDQIEIECRRCSYDLIMTGCNRDTAVETFQMVAAKPSDGVILLGSEMSEDLIRMIYQIHAPIIVIDNPMSYERVDSVVMANESIAYDAMQYLYQIGHRNIGYLHSSVRVANFEKRQIGYEVALEKLQLDQTLRIPLTPTLQGAYSDMKAYLQKDHAQKAIQSVSAFFADNDTIAIGAMKALQEFGCRIPDDISVIGVDDIPFSAINTPSLTTMRISRSSIGKLAVDTLLKRIAHPDSPNLHIQISGQLIERHSTKKLNSSPNS